MAKLNKRRAAALFEQAQLNARRGEWDKAAEAARPAAYDSELNQLAPWALLGEALTQLGRRDEAVTVLEDALKRFPKEAELEARLGSALLDRDDVERAVELLGRARGKLKRDPGFLTHYALALLRAGRTQEAEEQLAAALLTGGGLDTRLVMALAKGKRGAFEEAQALADTVEQQASDEPMRWAARAIIADCRLMLGDAAGALERWRAIEAGGRLEQGQLGHMAWAAQLAGEPALADRLIAARTSPAAEDRLLFAQIANLRGQPEQALAHLDAATSAPGERHPGWEYECLAARARALRLLGRREEAKTALDEALRRPEADNPRLGSRVRVDLGHLAAEEGDFETADAHFARALELDPGDPEAKRARELTSRKVAWRTELEASAGAKVEAARAEAETLKHRFLSREGELEQLRSELERMKLLQASAEARAQRAQEDVQKIEARAAAERQQRLREELEARERDVEEKAKANLELALQGTREKCPEAIWQMLLVAERTYQKALYTELPAAAVAVLFSGALERSLFFLLVSRFDHWLDDQGRRELFLRGATRERRGKTAEYFDHFVEAFDKEQESRAPALGEVGRVLERRHEPYLQPFLEFLQGAFTVPDGFYGELAVFVSWAKEKLRDPVAHGRGIELGWDELKRLRERLLFRFGETGPGMLPLLLGAPPG